MKRKAIVFFLAMALIGLVKDADGQHTEDLITLGPIILGKSLPADLATCPTIGWGNTGQKGICKEKSELGGSFAVWNVPYHGASLRISPGAGPVESVIGDIEDEMCGSVLDGLKAKFGPPTTIADREVMNRLGARWIETDYHWLRKNGDSLLFSLHGRKPADCLIFAQTAADVKASAKPEVKF
jgi:hypothetical protein